MGELVERSSSWANRPAEHGIAVWMDGWMGIIDGWVNG